MQGPIDEVFERLGFTEILAVDPKERTGALCSAYRPITDFAHDSAGCPNRSGNGNPSGEGEEKVFGPFETGEARDHEMSPSALELVGEGKVLRDAAGCDDQEAAAAGRPGCSSMLSGGSGIPQIGGTSGCSSILWQMGSVCS